MPDPAHDRAQNAELLVRARALRLHACQILCRCVLLRHRADHLLARSSDLRLRVEMQRASAVHPAAADDARDEDEAAEERAWYRAQVRQMLGAGWTRAELADIGISDRLMAELGLQWPAEAS